MAPGGRTSPHPPPLGPRTQGSRTKRGRRRHDERSLRHPPTHHPHLLRVRPRTHHQTHHGRLAQNAQSGLEILPCPPPQHSHLRQERPHPRCGGGQSHPHFPPHKSSTSSCPYRRIPPQIPPRRTKRMPPLRSPRDKTPHPRSLPLISTQTESWIRSLHRLIPTPPFAT